MAGAKIRGITIELNADASGIDKALSNINGQLKATQDRLKDVNKLLKLDPKNTELLTQKQKYLKDAINQTESKLAQLKEAQKNVTKGSEEWNAIQREIVDTEQHLDSLKKEYKNFGSVASQQMKAVGRAVSEAGGKIEAAGKKLAGISGAAAALGGGLLKLGYDAVTSADELNTYAKQTGLTTAEIQKMQYAADLVDVSFDSIKGALAKVKKGMAGNPALWEQLGVSVTNADGSMRDASDVFYDTLAVLSQVENETERDQLAMQVFGKSADELAGIVDDGGAALKAYGEQAEELGLILDQDTLDSLNATNDTIDQLKQNIAGTMAQIGSDVASVLAPLLEKAAELIGKITERLRALTPEQTETILKIVGVVAAVAPAIMVIGKLVSGIGSVISILGSVVGVLGGPVTIAIAAAIAAGVLLYKNWDTIKSFAINLKDSVIAAWEGLKAGVSNVIDGIKAKIDDFKQKFEDFKNKVKTIVDKIKEFFHFDFKLPDFPMPHFSIDPPNWKLKDLLTDGTIPRIKVDWYKKAYENPVMFTSPTVMATPAGYKGFGDGKGAEIVMGLDKLRELVGQGQNVTVSVILQGDAGKLFRAVNKTNSVRTKATNYNVLAAGGTA